MSRKLHASLTIEKLMDAAQTAEYIGFCIICGAEHDGVEPDARRYVCEPCGCHEVYGAEELVLMLV